MLPTWSAWNVWTVDHHGVSVAVIQTAPKEGLDLRKQRRAGKSREERDPEILGDKEPPLLLSCQQSNRAGWLLQGLHMAVGQTTHH